MADQQQEVEEENDNSGGPMAERYPAEPIENFDIGEIVERDVKQGREVKVKDSNGEWYAGEWVRKRMEATKDFPTQPTWAGYTTADLLKGVTEVPIEFNSLFRHIAIYGTTGYGKSTLLKNLMIQWAHAGYGFVYIDPKGDDVYELMEMLPEERLDDVIWIEPGSTTHDKVVGINFLEAGLDPDDDGFENEVNSIIDDLEDILRSESYWGPTMSAIIQNVGGWMVRQEEDFCMLDLYMLLSNEEEREKFADNVEDEVIKQYARQVSNKGQDEIDALLKRIQKWVESPVTREIVAHRQSTINLTQAVEEGKIILVRSASVDRKDIKRAVATGIIRRVWSAIKSRESIPKNEREPFFMVVDEFDDVASEDADIDKMLSKARSYRLGIVLANQQPHQLPKSLVSSIMGNCDNILSMNPGNPDDARLITKRLDSIKDRDVLNLGRFKIYARISVDAKKSSPFPMSTFAPYPPRRSREEVLDKIDEILDEYGVEPMTHQMETEHILDRVGEDKNEDGGEVDSPTGSNVETVETEDGNEISERQFFEAAFAAHIEKGSINDWVKLGDLEEQVEKKYGEIEYGAFDNMLEGIPRKYIERKMSGGEAFLRLTGEGERIAFQQDTGKSGSGGKFEHRLLLTRSYEVFQRLGAIVTLPEQEGKDQPDGLARPPINPFEQANSSLEEDRLREELQERHPRLVELFGYDTLAIEAESKTRTKPMQPLKNLSKAVRRGQTCVFVVESGTKKHDDFAHHAKTVDRILSRPPFVSGIQEKNGSKRRVFYNTGRKVELRGGGRALRKDKGNCVWTEDGNKIILENSEGDAIAEFTDKEEVNDPGREKFKYHYEYDRGESAMIVKDKDGNRVDSYSATEDKSARQRMLADGYSMVYQPFIPELEFPHGKLPKEDQWRIVVIPDDDEDNVPQLYKDGELTPLIELEAELDRDEDIKSQQESQAEEEAKAETTQTNTSTSETADDDEPEVASSSPKSNTDHIKDSDEVWTKPEPGDDDYDPTKDNSNYRTGYNEDYASEDWTGGDARDEEDFDDYVPPSERKKEETKDKEGSDSLNEAAVEGMMDNDGRPPDFKDERGKNKETEEDDDDDKPSAKKKPKRGGKRGAKKKRNQRTSKRGGKRGSQSSDEDNEDNKTQTENESENQSETETETTDDADDDDDEDDPLNFQV